MGGHRYRNLSWVAWWNRNVERVARSSNDAGAHGFWWTGMFVDCSWAFLSVAERLKIVHSEWGLKCMRLFLGERNWKRGRASCHEHFDRDSKASSCYRNILHAGIAHASPVPSFPTLNTEHCLAGLFIIVPSYDLASAKRYAFPALKYSDIMTYLLRSASDGLINPFT